MFTQLRSFVTQRRIEILLGLIVSGICLSLYLRTLAPSALGGDAGELQFVPYILSLTHPTGYPLHTLVGKLWVTIVPIGSVAYRMNLFSALVGTMAVGLIYSAILLSTGSKLSAFFSALLLGVSEVFWDQAITADKYILNAFFVAVVVLTLVKWSKTPSKQNLNLCALCYGISLTHHRSMVVFFPFLVGYWFWRDPRVLGQWRSLLRVAALILFPLILYLWLPIGASRELPPDMWHPTSLQGWIDYVLDRGYLKDVRPDIDIWQKMTFYGKTLVAQFTLYGTMLGLIGIIRQIRTRNYLWVFLVPTFVALAVLSAGYQEPRQWIFFLPSFVLFTLWIGEGLAWLSSVAGVFAIQSKLLVRGIASIILVSAVVLVAIPFLRNYPTFREMHLDGGSLDILRQDLKRGYLAQRFVKNGLPFVEPNSIIVADWEQATPLWYFQHVEMLRPDVTVMYPIHRLPEALATGRTTYLARGVSGIGESHQLTAVGTLGKVMEEPNLQLPPDIHPTEINWEHKIELLGYRFYQTDFAAGYVWPFSLYFRALKPLNENHSVSLRLFTEDGRQVWVEDRPHTVLGMYPTTRWIPGEIVADYYEVPFPHNMPAGRYNLGILLYASMSDGSLQNLTLVDSDDEVAHLFSIEVPIRE